MAVPGNRLVAQIMARLSTQLPSSWRVRHKARPGGELDLVLSVRKGGNAKLRLLPRKTPRAKPKPKPKPKGGNDSDGESSKPASGRGDGRQTSLF